MKTILCYGDSNTYGYEPGSGLRYPRDIRWTGVMAENISRDYNVVEEGCNGRTTIYDDPIEGWKNGLNYLKPCLNSHKPIDIIIVMLGSNDLKKAFGVTPDTIGKGIRTIIKTIVEFTQKNQENPPGMILVSPPHIGENICRSPFSLSFDMTATEYSKFFAPVYREVANDYNCIFFDSAACIEPSELDSLHLSPKAHHTLGIELAKIVNSLGETQGTV